ncbi:MAG: hypothetical protein P4L79_11505 [Legionella sp.]|uniref:hypothetical protein n=1 Tax=Legionella sp. TaxID=459 RepID=UPI0028450880|nr:hypothetical protein [Legionella sp.]
MPNTKQGTTSIFTLRQVHEAIDITDSMEQAAAMLNTQWGRAPFVFTTYLKQLGTSYDELKSYVIDSMEVKHKFPNYLVPVKKKRKKNAELDISAIYEALQNTLNNKEITIFSLAKSFEISSEAFEKILLSRGLSIDYLRAYPEELPRLYDAPRERNHSKYCLADIHQAILENKQLHPQKSKVSHVASANLFGLASSKFQCFFYQLVNQRILKNQRQDVLTMDDLAEMSIEEALHHFGSNYNLSYEFKPYSQEDFENEHSLHDIYDDIQKTQFGKTSIAFYYGMSNPLVFDNLLKKMGIDTEQLFNLGLEQAQQFFGDKFDVKLKDIPKNYFKKATTLTARASELGMFKRIVSEELDEAPPAKRAQTAEDDTPHLNCK